MKIIIYNVVWLINKFDVDVYDTTHDLHRTPNFYQNPERVLITILHSIFSAGGPIEGCFIEDFRQLQIRIG